MTIIGDISVIKNNASLSVEDKQKQIKKTKGLAFVNLINEGKVSEINGEPLIRKSIITNDMMIFIHRAELVQNDTLRIVVTFTKSFVSITHTINIVNPPVKPRNPIGEEDIDLRQALIEILESFV